MIEMRRCLRMMAEYFTEYDEDGLLKGSVWKTAFRVLDVCNQGRHRAAFMAYCLSLIHI